MTTTNTPKPRRGKRLVGRPPVVQPAQRELIQALFSQGYNITAAAAVLGVSPDALVDGCSRLGIETPRMKHKRLMTQIMKGVQSQAKVLQKAKGE